MSDDPSFLEALHGIGSRVDGDFSEKDVENAFLNEDFYELIGYEGAGHDLRSEWTLPDDRRPDYVTLDDNESVTAVYEFKTTGKDLTPYEDQLFHYVDELKADYGVLTNGNELRLFSREGHTRLAGISLSEAIESDAADIASALRKPAWDITDPNEVNDYLATLDEVKLDSELGREHFFDTFRLEDGSPFADLVTAMMDLLVELRDEKEAKFVKGAYDFWEASYASEPDETPDSWEPFIDGSHSLRDFMFCLESGHALLARLLLAKATEDHEFFRNTAYGGMSEYFHGLQGFGQSISLDAYPVAANGLIEDMEDNLVQSLFEDDIFVWWTDGFEEQMSRSHETRANQFRAVAEGSGEVTKISSATRDRFSRAIAHVFFSVLKFDFSEIEGDLLGDLYQHYFDPETRKALGEFYTPQPVIDYIMDGVDYDVGVSGERLIDPSCGSGTFLVEAVDRYIEDVERYNDDPDWEQHLIDLCTSPHIVGLDIHPFAVLMAQIRFMVAILPQYRKAKEQNRDFTIRRLPIYRTDTLRNERELTGIDLGDDGATQMTLDGVTDDNQDVKIPVPLPVEVDESEVDETEDGFLVQRVRMPLYDTARLNASIHNFGEYFAALQGVLDVVKAHMSESIWEYHGGLENAIHRYTTQEYDGIEGFFEPYVNDVLATVRYLREDHGDGRLFKIFEDTVLALVVKNYMEYDYVVGNPPYVRKESIPASYKESILQKLYSEEYSGNADLSIYFLKRGVEFLKENGKLGYITSSRFTSTAYGNGIRETLSTRVTIQEFSNFELSNFFEDATAYPCVLVLENSSPAEDYEIDVVYGREKPEDSNVSTVLDEIRELITDEERHITNHYSTYKTFFSDLDDREWRFTPKDANSLFRDLQAKSDYELSEIADQISAGIKTGKNTVFILTQDEVEDLDIENSLLKPIYRGSDVERFQMKEPEEFLIYTEGVDINDYPNAYDYLSEHKEALENRKDATFRNKDKEWYELNVPHTSDAMEAEKIICPEMSQRNNYALDGHGRYILNKVFFLHPEKTYDLDSEFLLGLLNSSTLEFFLKQTSSPLQNGYYQYLTRYQERLPIKTGEEYEESIANVVGQIRKAIDLRNRVESFPERYIDEWDGQFSYINYEWQTRRYPVSAEIQEKEGGRFSVTAGRSDEIKHPVMDSGDREEKKLRTKYVHASVNGRNMKKGEEQSIPIPQSQQGVEQLIEALENDKQTVAETDIDALEAEIDQAVYELFDLTDEEQKVIEDYLEVF